MSKSANRIDAAEPTPLAWEEHTDKAGNTYWKAPGTGSWVFCVHPWLKGNRIIWQIDYEPYVDFETPEAARLYAEKSHTCDLERYGEQS